MDVTRARTLVLVGAASLLVAFPLTRVVAEWWPAWPIAPWPVSVLLILLGGGVLAQAWPVRQFVRGKRADVDRRASATVLVLARTCSLAGAGLGGIYLAAVARVIVEWASPVLRGQLWSAAVAVVACGWLCATGQLGQLWCRLPPAPPEAPI
ncbi:MAG: DUF3180 domain-containing protein [Bifidobacteriaceae bacterium]|nr:DUF3180 domain-containing protein [Bifidobacteriaceae bacterium]